MTETIQPGHSAQDPDSAKPPFRPIQPVVSAPAGPVAEIAPDKQPEAVSTGRPDPYEAGMRVRRQVLGDAQTDRALAAADDFTRDFQELITRYAWGEVWTREGLDRRTRSAVTLGALIGGGHMEELAFHIRAALRNGLTPAEIKEVLLHSAVYCGAPAANTAFRVARTVIQEETAPQA